MVIITGASGLLGSVIAKHFLSNNVEVTGLYHDSTPSMTNINWIQCNINDVPSLNKALNGAECVVHTAAVVSFAENQKSKMHQVNVEGTSNVVNACLANGVKRLIHISSVAAIGKPANVSVISEQTPWAHASKPSNYGESKHLAELEVFRGEAEGLDVATINPSIILAAGNRNKSSGRIIQYVQKERPFYVEGNLNFVDARDVAEIAWKLYQKEEINGRYIASAGTISWKELFSEVGKRLNKKPPHIKVSPTLARLVAGIERLRSSISGSEPLITKETAKIARQTIVYSNKRVTNDLGVQFRSLQDTLDWCCQS